MWDLDPREGERTPRGSAPKLVPSATTSPNPPLQPQPVVVPNVQGLKQQFLQQQTLLTEMKEALRENESSRATKEKQLKIYEKKLSQIKNRQKTTSKNSELNVSAQFLSLNKEENETKSPAENLATRKMSELQKRLEENKIKFEERAEHGITESKKIESMVEQLRTQVQQSDATIHELQKNIDVPLVKLKPTSRKPQKPYKEHPLNVSKWTQTQNVDHTNPRIDELEVNILELKDTIKNQVSVIEASKRAANLLSKDLNKKEKMSVSELESVKCEMLKKQTNFEVIEAQFRDDLSEKDNRINYLDKELVNLESKNNELAARNTDIEKKMIELLTEKDVLERSISDLNQSCFVPVDQSSVETGKLEEKIAELTKELEDSNKLMIRLKLEHKNKLKVANKTLEKLKQSSDDKSELIRSEKKNEELVSVISNLKEKIAELEDEKVTILTDKQIMLEEISLKDNEITNLKVEIDELKSEKKTLIQNIDDLNMLVDNFNAGHSADFECFQIPGDTVSRQFDVSNESVQDQIGNLVKEKQELLEKLKNLAGSELLEVTPLIDQGNAQNTESVRSSEDNVDTYQTTGETNKTKPVDRKGSNNLKNKIKKLELQLKNEKEHVETLNNTIKRNEEQIQMLNEKIANFETNCSLVPDNINVLETQQACLSLENLLMQKTQQCEHLRTENLEVVHQLSEEKVLRTRAEEESEIAEKLLQQITALNLRISVLEEGIVELKDSSQKKNVDDFNRISIVIASKDTEIFNLENALADKTEKLEMVKDELSLLEQSLEDVLKHFENEEAEFLSSSAQVQSLLSKKVIGVLNAKESKRIELESFIKDQSYSYEMKLKELSEMLSSKDNECESLRGECHRLQVNLEATLTDAKLKIRESEVKIEELSKMLYEENSKLQNQQLLIRQRDEALLKAEETEKVLQSTWAERNDLIQSRDHICQQLNEVKRSLTVISKEKDNAISQCEILSKSLDQNKADVDMKHLLDTKMEELSSMTMKAKKLAANLKKKAQIEKDLIHQVALLTAEKEATTPQLSELSDVFDKLQKERDKNENYSIVHNELVYEKERLIEENQKLTEEKCLLTRQLEAINLQNNKLCEDLNIFKIDNENLLMDLQSVSSEKSDLEKEINNENSKCHELKLLCDSLLADKSSLDQRLDSLQEKWTFELNEKENAISLQKELLDRLNATKSELDEQVSEKQILQSDGVKWLQEKEQLIIQCQSLQSSLADSEKRNENLLSEIEQLKVSPECVVVLKTENQALIEKLSELTFEKVYLEKELQSNQNKVDVNDDRINDLSVSITKLQAMLSSLQEEKSKLEDQWAVFGENSRSEAEKYVTNITHLEKQVNNFNIAFDAEVQKNNLLKTELEESKINIVRLESEIIRLKEVKEHPSDEKIEIKKKKSVTFRTDDTDYIKELRGEVATLQRALESSDATVDELKAALDQQKPNTNLNYGSTAEPAPKSFDINLFDEPVNTNFFSNLSNPEPSDPFNDESLTWDDSWGAEGHLEAEHQAINQKPNNESLKVKELESEIKSLYAEKESLLEDHRVLQVKYTKVIKKLKEQKLVIDRLHVDIKNKNSSVYSCLDEAIIDELRTEIKKAEVRESELRKEFESLKLEKESLLKNIDVLNAGNDRFLEMKERQDKDAAVWLAKHTELRSKITELEAEIEAPAPDDSQTTLENRELKNLIEGLEWKVSELTEMVEEKDEEVERLMRRNQENADGNSQINDSGLLQTTTEKLKDAEQQLSLLITENDALQLILNSQKLETQTSSKIESIESTPQPSALYQLFGTDSSQPNFPCFLEDQQITSKDSISSNSYHTMEVDNLKHLIIAKDEGIQRISLELEKEHSAFETEKEIWLNKLFVKDEEIIKLSEMIADSENTYKQNKIEIEKSIEENRLQSDMRLVEELNDVRKSVEAKYQSLLKSQDSELKILRDSLGSNERDLNESQMTNDELVKKLKEQLREVDASSTRALEEKEIENKELSAECLELRELCNLRDNEILLLKKELYSINDALSLKQEEYNNIWSLYEKAQSELLIVKDSLETLSSKYKEVQSLLEERENELLVMSQSILKTKETNEINNLGQSLEMINSEINTQTQQSLSKEREIEEMKEALTIRDREIKELRSTLQTMHDEINHFRNFDNQLKEIRLQRDVQPTEESTEVDWSAQEAKNLSKLLESDLDNALYLLHQRDVRCDELTFELTQLLEERDALQLRLSAEIRKNAEVSRSTSISHNFLPQTQTAREADGELAHKLSELHTIEYGRDINIQDDTVQRYRDQMDVLSRDSRFKANTVFDV